MMSLANFQRTFDGWKERWQANQEALRLALADHGRFDKAAHDDLKREEARLLRDVLCMLSIHDRKPGTPASLAVCIEMAKVVCARG